MYQALYRKYRPQTLDDVWGQDVIVKIIKNSINCGKISHAYLFAGPRGTGKTSIAKIFAKMVNCENLTNNNPCGKCPSCIEPNNSDIIEIDAASNNGVDEIRELRNKVSLVPSYGKYKVYIIDEVHMLTTGAFNALLKTLEEPPKHVIFILATTDPYKIPETIISRCQRLDFKKITSPSIVSRLNQIASKENIKISKEATKLIASLSDGGMRDSIGMLDQAWAYTENEITEKDIHDINGSLPIEDMQKLISNILDGNLDEAFILLNQYNESGKNFIKLTEEIIEFMRNILLYKKAKKYLSQIEENIEIYQKISQKSTTNQIISQISILNKRLEEMKTSGNTKLHLELALIQMLESKENPQPSTLKQKQTSPTQMTKETTPTPSQTNQPPISQTPPKKTEDKEQERLDLTKIEQIKPIRIENTLANFNKKEMKILQNEISSLGTYTVDNADRKNISIILDGVLKAASDKNLVFVYKTTRDTNLFNENIINIEKILQKILNKKYKVIATDITSWEKIKNEFNSRKKKYIYQEEKFNIKDMIKKEDQNQGIEQFKDILEYQ